MKHWIRGHHYEITVEDIEASTTLNHPERIRIHWVFVRGVPWPVKQLIGLVTRRPRNTFNTDDALRILDALGYDLHWRGEPGLQGSSRRL